MEWVIAGIAALMVVSAIVPGRAPAPDYPAVIEDSAECEWRAHGNTKAINGCAEGGEK